MKFYVDQIRLFIVLSCISRLLTAPITSEKKSSKCTTAKGTVRSSVDISSQKDKQIHLIADLDALSHGIKRAATEEDCDVGGDKKDEVKEQSNGAAAGDKKDHVNVIKENSVINDQESIQETGKGAKIVESAKAALRSDIKNSTEGKPNMTAVDKEESSKSNVKGESNAQVVETKLSSDKKPAAGETSAKTFIARSKEASNKQQANAIHKSSIDKTVNKVKTEIKIGSEASGIHKLLHTAPVQSNSPLVQKGATSAALLTNAEKKSPTSIVTPLNNAIKSLDSATKLLGAVTAGKTAAVASAASTKSATGTAAASETAAVAPNVHAMANKTLVEESSTTRTASTSSSDKPASSVPAKAPAKDPYAEIANGPDSPKTPELKTGPDKAGLPVMKVDPGASVPEPVSFTKEETEPEPAAVQTDSPNRPGPQDVGGILDKLTDKLNKGGSAIEQPLPARESKEITDELSQFDNEALETAKGWETNGLKAIEKLKTAEFRHGSMKNELSKELTERLADDANIDGGAGESFAPAGATAPAGGQGITGDDIPSDLAGLGSRESFGPQSPSQWPEMNSIENLDTEAQKEESPFGQLASERSYGEGYGGQGGDPAMSPDSNAYDRQEIAGDMGAGMYRGGEGIGSEQGQFYKRSIILKPLYYYYHHLPYAFKHPYDD